MSIYSNPVINVIDIPWKVFVKGASEPEPEPDKPVNQIVRELNFSPDEARKAYEEILTEHSSRKKNVTKKYEDKVLPKITSNTQKSYTKAVTINSIMKAVEQRDINFLKEHIHTENVNSTDHFGWTPLMLAAYCGFVDIVDFLLKSGANKQFREKSGLTAAQLALKKNYLDIVALLRKNNNVKTEDYVNIQDLSINKKVEESKKNDNEKDVAFYCDVCKDEFKSKRHETSILHLFNLKPKRPSTFFGISKTNKGYQMLLSNGWDEEHGLGKDGKGQKFPLKTVLKVDRKGLGTTTKVEPRVTHFKPGDINAIKSIKPKINNAKFPTKKDREKLLSREARKDRALRIALS